MATKDFKLHIMYLKIDLRFLSDDFYRNFIRSFQTKMIEIILLPKHSYKILLKLPGAMTITSKKKNFSLPGYVLLPSIYFIHHKNLFSTIIQKWFMDEIIIILTDTKSPSARLCKVGYVYYGTTTY